MSASLLARQRKRRREEAFHAAHDLLGKPLPRGAAETVRVWVAELTDEEVQWGGPAEELRALLRLYRKPYRGL